MRSRHAIGCAEGQRATSLKADRMNLQDNTGGVMGIIPAARCARGRLHHRVSRVWANNSGGRRYLRVAEGELDRGIERDRYSGGGRSKVAGSFGGTIRGGARDDAIYTLGEAIKETLVKIRDVLFAVPVPWQPSHKAVTRWSRVVDRESQLPIPMERAIWRRMDASCWRVTREPVAERRLLEVAVTRWGTAQQGLVQPFSGVGAMATERSGMASRASSVSGTRMAFG